MTQSASGILGAAARALLGPEVSVAVWGEDLSEAPRLAAEASVVAAAVPARRDEFHRGRACARFALERIGGPQVPIGVGPNREPLWPDGFVGAISHCHGLVVAVVASADHLCGVGIDIERRVELEDAVQDLVLSEGEGARGRGAGGAEPVLFFSAKESVHKAVFPGSRVWLDFKDVTIRLEDTGRALGRGRGAFRVEAATERARAVPLGALRGRWSWIPGHVVTAVRWEG